jgi:hypothetical protein
MTKATQSQANLLKYWLTLDYLNPALLPDKPSKLRKDDFNTGNRKHEQLICLGIFPSVTAFDFIRSHFKSLDQNENEVDVPYVSASFKISTTGTYDVKSFSLSMLPFALHQLHKKSKITDWHDAFKTFEKELKEDVEQVLLDSTGQAKPLIFEDLSKANEIIAEKLQWSASLDNQLIYGKDLLNKGEAGILNSFFTKDLDAVIKSVGKYSCPPALNQYLNAGLNRTATEKIDIVKNIQPLVQDLQPQNYPYGCWPSQYTLSLMQQFAVNQVSNDIATSAHDRVFAVNGPPGTGKTTLLRDIIAGNIVKKALAQSSIKDPKKLFSKQTQLEAWRKEDPTYAYYPITGNDAITDFGMFISSSNNGAVENVTKELPLKEAIYDPKNEASYFSEVAEQYSEGKDWGLISGVLGNRTNVNNFFEMVTKKDTGLLAYLDKKTVAGLDEWQQIVADFENAKDLVYAEKQKINQLVESFSKLEVSTLKLNAFRTLIYEAEATIQHIQEAQSTLDTQKEQLADVYQELLEQKFVHEKSAPGFFKKIFSNEGKIHHAEMQVLNAKTNKNQLELKKLDSTEKEHTKNLNKQTSNIQFHQQEVPKLEKKIAEITAQQHAYSNEGESNFIGSDFWTNINSTESQVKCPWYFKELKRLNSELFLKALKVNEAFIHAANRGEDKAIHTNLLRFSQLMKREINPKIKFKEKKELWDNLFLVVPVLSGAFASIQTLFEGLSADSIPWLFVDEAGQALPQMATGAIWRSKRVVVVGDPLQIEPVNTLPETFAHFIAESYELTSEDLTGNQSIQTIADKGNQYGTWIKNKDGATWLGTPLKVHRRCLDPMFSIANAIAYDGAMVLATLEKEMKPKLFMENAFVHIEGKVMGKHYVPEEGQAVLTLLLDEIKQNGILPNVFVITPFSAVAFELKVLLRKELSIAFPMLKSKEIETWLKESVGTVHTFQGKEADGVILCLGCDETKVTAAAWASSKPNLLNVALTRAKYRFVAVGNKNVWLKQRFFSELKNLTKKEELLNK